ncbi:Probable inorganic polyphosphate/ATP-NAD kinase 1 [Weissella viridescens]|uniref:Probable inorganic polyphosphate/ATP-NAD kinase 1 n=1 Tax=Weissella viridescens TaxID=1629 RepID=A0A380P8E0_WEIVI|nr:Probable inorganic polyphosphate/ATP-NAD kinase 1 [Weissella viridescens]
MLLIYRTKLMIFRTSPFRDERDRQSISEAYHEIAIYHNDNDHSVEVLDELKTKILARDDADIIFDDAHPDIVISVGGDGTLLSAFHAYEQQLDHVRFIGVHTGHLGFYADWQDFELDDLVNSLVHDSKESVEYPIVQANLFLLTKLNEQY